MSEARTGVVQVVTTTDSEQEAQRLAEGLVQQRLVACVQVDGPIRSTFWWQGEAATEQEWRVTIKTSTDRYPQVASWLASNHSYDVPEILATDVVAGHEPYVRWVHDETGPPQGSGQ